MFSGKTERLIARLRQEQAAGRRVLAFKHVIDNRYDPTHLITHTQDRFAALRARDAAEVVRTAADADVVAIDEGHFFGPALVDAVRRMVAAGKTIIIAGLEFNAWGRPFTPMPELAALADDVIVRTAPCKRCGAPAHYSQRLVPVTSHLLVGGSEAYEPRCARCFEPLPGEPPEGG
jgi:thymidine kinase